MESEIVTLNRERKRATQKQMCVALLLASILTLLGAGCDGAVGSSGDRIRLLITPVATPTTVPPTRAAAAPVKYTVSSGDTLYGIALTFGVTVDDIVRVNNIADPNSLSEGQVLTIPARSADEPPTATLGPSPTASPSPPPAPSATPPSPDATPPQGPDIPNQPTAEPSTEPATQPTASP